MTRKRSASPLPAIFSVCAAAAFIVLILEAEKQWAVLTLIGLAVLVLGSAARSGFAGRAALSFSAHRRLLGGLAGAATLIVAGVFHNTHFALLMLATVLLYTVACLGLTIQCGFAGVVNFAGAAFFAVGCYTAAILSQHTALPHLLVIACGGVLAAALGSLLILPVLRTRGHYAALITIAFGILFKTFLEVNDTLGGPQGLKVPGLKVLGYSFNDNISWGDVEISFYINYLAASLVLAGLAFALVRRIERSWIGVSFDAVRLDETAAAVFGFAIARWKITAFTLGNLLAGFAGALYAMMIGFVAPNNFTFADSLILVSIVILGGIGNPWGILPAAAIVLILPEKLQFIQEYRFLLYAALVIAILLFRPDGLLPRRLRVYLPGRAQ